MTKGLCNQDKHPTCTFQKVIQHKYKNMPEDAVPVFGHVVSPRHKIFARLYRSEHKRNFYHIDHAYFFRSHYKTNPSNKIWYRISKNGHMQTSLIKDADSSRWEKYFAHQHPVQEYNKTGKHILVCPLGGAYGACYGQDPKEWLQDVTKVLKDNTDRPIRVRNKPWFNIVKDKMVSDEKVSVDEDLEDCYAVVTHSSTVAIQAQLKGIPTFCDPSCCAVPVSHTDFTLIETPKYDKDIRQQWLHTLSWSQFRLEDFSSGYVHRHIEETMYDGP
ncbi:hypothetical protein H8E06_00145 [bacterium]|nr:hypothetical protein [bacterium]